MQANKSRLVTVVLKTAAPHGQPRYTEVTLDVLAVEAAGLDATIKRRDWLEAATQKIIELLDEAIRRLDPRATTNASQKRDSIKAMAHNIHNYAAYDGIVLALNGIFNPRTASPPDTGGAHEQEDLRRQLEWYRVEYPRLQQANTTLQNRVIEMEPVVYEHRIVCPGRPTRDELEKCKSEAAAYKEANERLNREKTQLKLQIGALTGAAERSKSEEVKANQALIDARNRISELLQRANDLGRLGTPPAATPDGPHAVPASPPAAGTPPAGGDPELDQRRVQTILDLQKQLAAAEARLNDEIAQRAMASRENEEVLRETMSNIGGAQIDWIDDDEDEKRK